MYDDAEKTRYTLTCDSRARQVKLNDTPITNGDTSKVQLCYLLDGHTLAQLIVPPPIKLLRRIQLQEYRHIINRNQNEIEQTALFVCKQGLQ